MLPKNKTLAKLSKTKPIVALVGRENVGKSTLFNRLTGASTSIVSSTPGTTRDRLFGDVVWAGKTFVVVDTAGLAHEKKGFVQDIHEQVEMAANEADLILFIVDAKDGLTAVDHKIARWLNHAKKKVVVVANKIDKPISQADMSLPFFEFGFKEVLPISALSGKQVGDLLDVVASHVTMPATSDKNKGIVASIVGKPNVGKSSLLNALISEKRVRVSDMPGTTRDAVFVSMQYGENIMTFVDTAGLRRKARISQKIEKESAVQSLKAINNSEIVLALFDTTKALSQQDIAIIRYAHEARKGIIIVINKWDLEDFQEAKFEKYIEYFQAKLPLLSYAPIIFVSAKTKQHIPELLEIIEDVHDRYYTTFEQKMLDLIFPEILPALGKIGKIKKKRLKVLSLKQIDVAPPAFQMEINRAELLSNFHINKIEQILRNNLPLEGTPIVMHFKVKGTKK